MALWSRQLQLEVARANRILKAAEQRIKSGKASPEMKLAVRMTKKEIRKLYGKQIGKFKLSGIKSEGKIKDIERVIDRVLHRKTLTIKGQEVEERRKSAFFQNSGITDEETQSKIWGYLMYGDNNLLTKAKELGYKYEEVIDAFNTLSAEGLDVKKSGELLMKVVKAGETKNDDLSDYLRTNYPGYFKTT